jgi:hypothetical protein
MKTPEVAVDTMPAVKFFAYAEEILKLQPPHVTDQPIIAQLKRIGIEPGKALISANSARRIRAGLEPAREEASQLMAWKVPTLATVTSGWSMNTDTMGVYGTYYLKRAIVLSEAGDRRADGSRRQPAGRRDLSPRSRP